MVLKTGKFGVRSGNTFKASNSKFLRQYMKEAVLIKSHINGTQERSKDDFDDVLDSVDEMSEIVSYSLNKKGRWKIPDELKKAINGGGFEDNDFGVQLIEFHKIKKKANCISMYSSEGDMNGKLLKKKRKGYLHASNLQDNNPRESRRQRRERIRRGLPVEEPSEQPQVEEPAKLVISVVYPSSLTSSVTHNPKYIGHDIRKPFVWEGYQNRRGRQRVRRKWQSLAIQDCSEYMDIVDDSEEETDDHEEYQDEEGRKYNLIFEEILKHANNAKKLTHYRHKSTDRVSKPEEQLDRKGRVIYQEKEPAVAVGNPVSISPSNNIQEMQSVLVSLPNESVDPALLRRTFSDFYHECECFPRKFVIDISDRVSRMDMFKTSATEIITFIVVAHDVDNEVNNALESMYKISLNTVFSRNKQSFRIETLFDYMETNLEEIVEKTLFYIETLPESDFELSDNKNVQKTDPKIRPCALEASASWTTHSYKPTSSVVFQEFLTQNKDDNTEASCLGYECVSVFDTFELGETGDIATPNGKFCAVCYESLGGSKPGTALISCGHWLCDSCWQHYLETKMSTAGSPSIPCPEYDCDKTIDPGTIISLSSMRCIIRFAKSCHDTKVEQQKTYGWCPNKNCGRVLKVSSVAVKLAHCVCGEKVCMECFGKHHYPASCEDVQNYYSTLRRTGDIGILPPEALETITVNGKHCPNCKRFVKKKGGCPSMICVCGKNFCWGCGRPYEPDIHHPSSCYRNGYNDKHDTVQLEVKPEDLLGKIKRKRWYKVALEHRIHQHPLKLRKMKSSLKQMKKKLKGHIYLSQRNMLVASLMFENGNKTYASEAEKVADFLMNTMQLYTESHHLIENSAILIESQSLSENKQKALIYAVSRLRTYALVLYDLFISGKEHSGAHLFNKLKEVRVHTLRCIRGLVKIVTPTQKSS